MPRQGHQEGRPKRGRPKKVAGGRAGGDELYARLLYFSLKHLHLTERAFWLMPFGLLMDLWECHRQELGISRPRREANIDDVIPEGI